MQVPRMIITILENFQNEDGSVDVPEPLRPFLGGKAVLTPEDVSGKEEQKPEGVGGEAELKPADV